MPKYFYLARNKTGERISGSEEGATQDEVINRLQAKDLVVVSISPESGKEALVPAGAGLGLKGKFVPKHNWISSVDLTLFCRQLATLLGAGVTILKSLSIISQQVASKRLYLVIRDL